MSNSVMGNDEAWSLLWDPIIAVDSMSPPRTSTKKQCYSDDLPGTPKQCRLEVAFHSPNKENEEYLESLTFLPHPLSSRPQPKAQMWPTLNQVQEPLPLGGEDAHITSSVSVKTA